MKKTANRSTLILGLIFFIIIVYNIFLFNNTVNYEFEKSIRNTLIDMADQQQIALNRQLDSIVYNLTTFSETITLMSDESFELNQEDIMRYINTKKDSLHFDTIMISDSTGDVLLTTSSATDISQYNYFSAAISGDVFATEPHISPFTGEKIVTVAVPIHYERSIIGVLAVEYSIEYLTSLLTTFTDANGINLVINEDSDIMLSTNSFVISFDAFATAKFDNGLTFEQIVADFKNGNSGSISYTISGIKKLGEYRPININNWMLFFEISEETMTKSANNISFRMILISITIILFAFAIILLILFSRKDYLKTLEKIAYYDKLTGGPNLLKLKMHMETVLSANPNDQHIIVKMDIANFKAINAVFGVDIANKVLCAIAETSKEVNETSFLKARITADEFFMFASGEHLANLEEDRKYFESHFKSLVPELKEYNFYFRYGRYFIKNGETDVNEIINKVTIAHRFAKTKNISNVWDYDEIYSQQVLKEAEIANKMHKALDNNEFQAYLQPKYDIQLKKIVGAEALVRWIESDHTMIYPGEFIPLFEQNGFIIDLDKHIFKCVCEMLSNWKNIGVELIPISINFSRLHIHNLNFVNDLKQIASSYQIETRYLEIEITETAVLENESELLHVITELKDAGFSISIDDFGSGYSSLGMLKNFKADTLKLDRSFFTNTEEKPEFNRGKHIVKSIVELATALGMNIVAEGIETENQLEFIKSVHCYVIQGYYFSRPIPIIEFEKQYLI